MADSRQIDTSDNADVLVGQLFEGRFQVLSVLGEGGMGKVYKARHIHMDKLVAIKTLVPSAISDQKSLMRFKQESRSASALGHPNIISIMDFGASVDGLAYLVMEYVEGKTLESIILTEEPMTLQRFQRIFSQVCSGMQHAHKKGFIHRDLKPSNLMVYDTEDDTDVVKILDFGLAKACHGDDKQQNLTRTGMVMGSPPFMSPEQCRGEELDYRSDIYSLGCVMFAALTGEVPLLGDNTMATLYKHISGVPLSISEVAPHLVIPASLETVIMRTLEKFPDDRPQSMEELGVAIASAIGGSGEQISNARAPIAVSVAPKTRDFADQRKPESGANGGDNAAPSLAVPSGFNDSKPLVESNSRSQNKLQKIAIPSVLLALAAGAFFVFQSGGNGSPPLIHSQDGSRGSDLAAVPASNSGTKSTANSGIISPAPSAIVTAAKPALSSADATAKKPVSNSADVTAAKPVLRSADVSAVKPAFSSTQLPATDTSMPHKSAVSSNSLPTPVSNKLTASMAAPSPTVKPLPILGNSPSTKSVKAPVAPPSTKAPVDSARQSALATNSQDTATLANELRQRAIAAYSNHNAKAALRLARQELELEKKLFGPTSPRLIPTLALIAGTCRNEQESLEVADEMDLALNIFSTHKAEAEAAIRNSDFVYASWRSLGGACTGLGSASDNETGRERYFQWATVFFEEARRSWSGSKNQQYFQMLRQYLKASTAIGDVRRSGVIGIELRQSGQRVFPRFGQGPLRSGDNSAGDETSPGGRFDNALERASHPQPLRRRGSFN